MKKLLKLNPDYLIGTGFLITSIKFIFFDTSSDIGFGIFIFSHGGGLPQVSFLIIIWRARIMNGTT